VIKLFSCVRRSSEVSEDQFRKYWNDHHKNVLQGILARLSPKKSTHNLIGSLLTDKALLDLGAFSYDYDLITEVVWESEIDVLAVLSSIEGQEAIQHLACIDSDFIDLSRSSIAFFSEE